MDISNPKMINNVDEMFGDKEWHDQDFIHETGLKREKGFLEYFVSKINAKYKLLFRICSDIKDKSHGDRTKYYLIHASNHIKAVLLMKQIMWPLGDEEGIFQFSGTIQQVLFSSSPEIKRLKELLIKEYIGQKVEFQKIIEETWEFPYIEKQYRKVIKELKSEGKVIIKPVSSKTDKGLKGKDFVEFLLQR